MATADSSAKVSELASRYMSDNMQTWQRYAEELRRVSESVIPAPPTAANWTAPLGNVPAFARELMALNLAHYSKLLNSYAELTNGIMNAVFQAPEATATGSAPAAAATPPNAKRIELVFSGETGESVSQSLAVANKKAESIDVAFELSEFSSENGASRFRVPVTFVPETFVLSPGAERVVECRVPFVEAFIPGTRYMALVRVVGFPGLETALIVLPTRIAQRVADYDRRAAAAPPINATVVASTTGAASAKAERSRVRRSRTRSAAKSGKTGKSGNSSKNRKRSRNPRTASP